MSMFATTTNIDAISPSMATLPCPERQIHRQMVVLYRLPSSVACIIRIDAPAKKNLRYRLRPMVPRLRRQRKSCD